MILLGDCLLIPIQEASRDLRTFEKLGCYSIGAVVSSSSLMAWKEFCVEESDEKKVFKRINNEIHYCVHPFIYL